jgi:hypothetical protein
MDATTLIFLFRYKDAKDLSKLRLQIDGETENLDRQKGN